MGGKVSVKSSIRRLVQEGPIVPVVPVPLDKTAQDIFQMLPKTEVSDIDSAITALAKWFKPKNIEELRGLEFHHRSRSDENID